MVTDQWQAFCRQQRAMTTEAKNREAEAYCAVNVLLTYSIRGHFISRLTLILLM
jgi:hypothetical protein